MDAAAVAAAALAIAVENSEPTAMQELLLERERLAMDREGLRSELVERHYVQPPPELRGRTSIWTWREALEYQNELLEDRYDAVRHEADRLRENLDNVIGDMQFMIASPLRMARDLQTGQAIERRSRADRSRSRRR